MKLEFWSKQFCRLNPGGDSIIREYQKTKSLTDSTRRKMIRILTADMTERHSTSPPKHIREMYAQGIVSLFPNLRDPYTKNGYIEQDFVLMFGEKTSAKFLERWPTTFMQKVIQQSKGLHFSQGLQDLIDAAESAVKEDQTDDAGWDSDLASVLLLLHLIPPSPQGRKRPGKMSAHQAERNLIVFKKAGTNIQEHLNAIDECTQPYLLAMGTNKNNIHVYYIILDKQAIPCKSVSGLGAFDELFKAHFVFGASYSKVLHNMYTFVQTTIFQIDIGKVKESPRVAELRARFVH
ncbi:uncharacterized protein [Chanodichthys erythropterus]